MSTWKRQAMYGLGAVFANGAGEAGSDHEAEVHDLHAKIGQLAVERDFFARGLARKGESGANLSLMPADR